MIIFVISHPPLLRGKLDACAILYGAVKNARTSCAYSWRWELSGSKIVDPAALFVFLLRRNSDQGSTGCLCGDGR